MMLIYMVCSRAVYLNNRMERMALTMEPTGIVTGIEEVTFTARPLVRELRKIPKRVKSLVEKLPHLEVCAPKLVII
jgi:hypothetical protein